MCGQVLHSTISPKSSIKLYMVFFPLSFFHNFFHEKSILRFVEHPVHLISCFKHFADTNFFAMGAALVLCWEVQGQKSHCIAFWDLVIDVWMNALKEVVLHIPVERMMAWGKPQHPGSKGVHLDSAPAIAKLHIGEVCAMLQVSFFAS